MAEPPEVQKPNTPVGWYEDPQMMGTQRYWNGEKWTDHWAPLPPVAPPPVGPVTPLRIAAVILVLAAIALWFGMAPADSYEDLRADIESTDALNNESTEGAPQQAVVNGWTTIRYLELLSIQQEESDDRRDSLLLLALVGGAVGMATLKTGSKAA